MELSSLLLTLGSQTEGAPDACCKPGTIEWAWDYGHHPTGKLATDKLEGSIPLSTRSQNMHVE